ncbi:IS5 family transposase [Acinetobacter defluvii]|uniref:IS5 family transposase n=1 Tax=Acinetobacter defluvii TaxID=1871111 RepID=UPI0038991FA3
MADYERHDLSDELWIKLEPLLTGKVGDWGAVAKDNRKFINAVLWILRTGAPWRDLPPSYGGWKNTHRRFCRWRDKGVWERILEKLIDEPDLEWLMIDSTHIKVHKHATGAVGGNQEMSPYKRGLNTKIHLSVDAHGMPIRVIITAGSEADCKYGKALIKDISAQQVFGDKAYDTNEIIDYLREQKIEAVIPPKYNRKQQRAYDKHLYKYRHLVENAFMQLKTWRGIAFRYAKRTASFKAALQIKFIMMWLRIS